MFGSSQLDKLVGMLEESSSFIAEQGQEYIQQLIEYSTTAYTYGIILSGSLLILSIISFIVSLFFEDKDILFMISLTVGLLSLAATIIFGINLLKLHIAPTMFIIDHVLGG